MITERTLKKWRKEALIIKDSIDIPVEDELKVNRQSFTEYMNRIIRMTQELLDQHLLRK